MNICKTGRQNSTRSRLPLISNDLKFKLHGKDKSYQYIKFESEKMPELGLPPTVPDIFKLK
jgi:hypothetical protein